MDKEFEELLTQTTNNGEIDVGMMLGLLILEIRHTTDKLDKRLRDIEKSLDAIG